jgi:hypothetical protein
MGLLGLSCSPSDPAPPHKTRSAESPPARVESAARQEVAARPVPKVDVPDTMTDSNSNAKATPPLENEISWLVTPAIQKQLSEEANRLDPRRDGWNTEAFVVDAKAQLRIVLAALAKPFPTESNSAAAISKVVSMDFVASALRPQNLRGVFRDDAIEVWRATPEELKNAAIVHRGAQGLRQALAEIAGTFQDSPRGVESDFHVHSVTMQGNVAATKVLLQLVNRGAQRVKQVSTAWECLWQMPAGGLPQIAAIRVADYEEVSTRPGQGIWFADCTESVLAKNLSFKEQLVFGLDHWLQRVERVHAMHVFAATGLAVGDVNGDGLDDVYVCQPGGLPNRLYVQNLDGTATDLSVRARVDWLDHTSSALIVDLDNDGDQDLVLATLSGLLVMSNDSTGRFELKALLPTGGSDPQSLSAADYDNDRDVDLYITANFPKSTADTARAPIAFVYHDANDGAPNLLFRNDIEPNGTWAFTDVTAAVGLDVDNRRHSLAAAWEDFDNDGDQDLYVANDYGQNCLYKNDGGKFTNVASAMGVVEFGSGMSVSWGDANRDGWIDLYVGNMYSSAGNRVTPQDRFRPNDDPRTRSLLRRFAKGNSLFENVQGAKFQEMGSPAHVEVAQWAWSSLFLDVDNNGWEDLFVANGYITTEDQGDL